MGIVIQYPQIRHSRPKDVKAGRPLKNHDNVMKLGQGNSLAYTLRRLACKRPDLLAAYERGELSANAAAIEAGFRRKKLTKEELKMTTKLLPAAIIAAIAATLGFVGHD